MDSKSNGTNGANGVSTNPSSLHTVTVVNQESLREQKTVAGDPKVLFKDIIILSISVTLVYTSFYGMRAMAVYTVYDEDGYDDSYWIQDSFDYYYISFIVGCLFLPTYLIRKFTAKRTILVSMIVFTGYIGLVMYPKKNMMIICNLLSGLTTATLWPATLTYITSIGNLYASLRNYSAQFGIVLSLGIFFLVFQSYDILLYIIDREIFPNFYNDYDFKNYLYKFGGIYLALALIAVFLIAVFLNPLEKYGTYERDSDPAVFGNIDVGLASNVIQLIRPYQLLIIPLTIWAGMNQEFLYARIWYYYHNRNSEYYPYYLRICFLSCNGIVGLLFSPITRTFGRIPIFSFGALLNIGAIIYYHVDSFSDDSDDDWWRYEINKSKVYLYTAVWAISTALWTTQLIGFYGTIFSKNWEAAFSNYTLWTTVGLFLFYGSGWLQFYGKLTDTLFGVYLSLVIVGMIGYYVIEYKENRKSQVIPQT